MLSHAYLQGCDDIDKVVHYLAEHHAEPLTLPQVARSFQMSEFHFSRVFKRSTGNSFKDFLIQLRVAQACRLLMHSNQQIADIGYAVGFHNLANFNRRFLEVKGATPSAFRRAFRDG